MSNLHIVRGWNYFTKSLNSYLIFLFFDFLSHFFPYLTYLFYFSFCFLSQGMFLSVSSVSLSNRINKRWCKIVAIFMMPSKQDSTVAGTAQRAATNENTCKRTKHKLRKQLHQLDNTCTANTHNTTRKNGYGCFLGDTKKWLWPFVTLEVTEIGYS